MTVYLGLICDALKVSKSQKKNLVSSILPKNERSSLSYVSTEGTQDSEFRSIFGRIQDAIICFRDLLTFSSDVGKPTKSENLNGRKVFKIDTI